MLWRHRVETSPCRSVGLGAARERAARLGARWPWRRAGVGLGAQRRTPAQSTNRGDQTELCSNAARTKWQKCWPPSDKAQKLRFLLRGGHLNNQGRKKKKKKRTERLKITQENHALFMSMERWHACSSSLDLFPSHTGSQEHPCAYSPFSCPTCATARSSPPIPSCKSQVIRRPAASAPRPMEPPTGASRSPCRASCRRAASRHLGWGPTKDLLRLPTSSGTTRPVPPWAI